MINSKEIINKTINYLEENYPQKYDLHFIICGNYATSDTTNNVKTATLSPNALELYIIVDNQNIQKTINDIANEYWYFMQRCNDKTCSQYNAEEFSNMICKAILSE